VGVLLTGGAKKCLEHLSAAGEEDREVIISTLREGSYVRRIYRGPYYGLQQAWADFVTSLCSAESEFQVVEGAPCFQIFSNYGESTLAADLRTDLFIRIH
jgi:hypothetical protein